MNTPIASMQAGMNSTINNAGKVKLLVQQSSLSHFRPGTLFNLSVADLLKATVVPDAPAVTFPVRVSIIQGFGNVLRNGKRLILFLQADGTVAP